MVFMGLGRFHRSTLTHHSLCWDKAEKRMQKNIFFAFRFPMCPHGKLTLYAGGEDEAQKIYIMLHPPFAKQIKCGAPEGKNLKVVNYAHLASRYVYISLQATSMNHRLFISVMSFARINIFWFGLSSSGKNKKYIYWVIFFATRFSLRAGPKPSALPYTSQKSVIPFGFEGPEGNLFKFTGSEGDFFGFTKERSAEGRKWVYLNDTRTRSPLGGLRVWVRKCVNTFRRGTERRKKGPKGYNRVFSPLIATPHTLGCRSKRVRVRCYRALRRRDLHLHKNKVRPLCHPSAAVR